VKKKDGETVVFAFAVYKNRKHRDEVMKKVMADPAMKMDPATMTFDGKRMFWGGFTMIEMRPRKGPPRRHAANAFAGDIGRQAAGVSKRREHATSSRTGRGSGPRMSSFGRRCPHVEVIGEDRACGMAPRRWRQVGSEPCSWDKDRGLAGSARRSGAERIGRCGARLIRDESTSRRVLMEP
jgi:hypothetical protein